MNLELGMKSDDAIRYRDRKRSIKDGYVVLYDRNNRMNSIHKAIEEKEFT